MDTESSEDLQNINNYDESVNNGDSDDEMFTKSKKARNKRSHNLLDSDDENDSRNSAQIQDNKTDISHDSDSSISNDESKTIETKKRIVRKVDSDSDESEKVELSNDETKEPETIDNGLFESGMSTYTSSNRIKEKGHKFENKFKSIMSKRNKSSKADDCDIGEINKKNVVKPKTSILNLYDSESEDEKKHSNEERSAESSNDERDHSIAKSNHLTKQNQPSFKEEKTKVQRMSAKQAMEQMQKIKSESSRMLREKQVSLPYHKPKQLSLKDILAKRKPTISSGNYRFGFKMNSDQLKEYAKELKNREKEILELCKSESEEEEDDDDIPLDDKKENQENSENNKEDVEESCASVDDTKHEFISLQKACKNLLDIFDEKENKTNSKESHGEIDDVEIQTENGDPLPNDKIYIAEETNIPNTKDESLTLDKPILVGSKENQLNSLDSEDNVSVGKDSENNAEVVDIPAPIGESIVETKTENLTESEQLFQDTEDTDMEFDFKLDEAITKANDFYDSNKLGENVDQPSATQIENKEPSDPSQSISCSAPTLNSQPKLTGSPGCFIDLISGEVKSGVELLKKKFLFHAAIKTPDEMEREKERRIHPGSALLKLKKELENKIMDNRTQEWTKRLEELDKKKKEENDNLSDYEEILEKEERVEKEDEFNEEESCEEEEEPEENDVDLTKEKTRKKCSLLDEEAEVDDEENIVSADEAEDNNGESDGDSESSDDSDDDLVTNSIKKPLTRILKPFNDSDSSDDETNDDIFTEPIKPISNKDDNIDITMENYKDRNDLMTPIKENGLKRSNTSDLFDSYEWDEMPLGQRVVQLDQALTPTSDKKPKNISLVETTFSNGSGRSDLANLVSPIIKLTGVPRTFSNGDNTEEFLSPTKYSFQYEKEKINDLQKKLLFDSEGSQSTQDLQDLESLCSGRFPTQDDTSSSSSKPSNLDKLIDDEGTKNDDASSQDLENELLGLCTGKFVGINDTQSHAMNTMPVSESQNITLSLSENTEDLNGALINVLNNDKAGNQSSDVLNKDENIPNSNSIPNSSVKDSKIDSFFKISDNHRDDTNVDKNRIDITVSTRGGKLAIFSSDEEEISANKNGDLTKSKVTKSKKERNKKRKIHLQFSDDESEDEDVDNEQLDEEDNADLSDGDGVEKMVEYDSEENEIEITTEKINNVVKKKKKASEFIDQEAELTSEDEWVGSGDEDERGMDKLEWEEGDADQLDQREVKKQLERIHLRTILDDDKREVRMLQEILLEDDLEGGTRERKFRWRNIDSTIEVGSVVGDDDVDTPAAEDMQTEEEWRKQRHERESFLRQMMEKENAGHLSQEIEMGGLKIVSRTSSSSSIIQRKSSTKDYFAMDVTNNDAETNAVEKELSDKSKKILKDLPSPVKKPFSLLKNNVRGSFLSRGQAALNRLAMLTKNAPQPQEQDEPTNLSSLAPGKKKNFVFATVSPPCNKNEIPEDVKKTKRKATSEISTPTLIKKTRLVEQATSRTRKSLIDHID